MRKRRPKKTDFPHYLKSGAGDDVMRWLGDQLKRARGTDSHGIVAQRANASVEQIRAIEKGRFHLNLGQLREIIDRGYRLSLGDLLAKCYEVFHSQFDPESAATGKKRPFDRDCHYSLCLEDSKDGKQKSTPLFIGGDPDNYLWAIPMRRLRNQPILTELLELAPSRKLKRSGVTPDNAHEGVEVIHVIYGTIDAKLSLSGEALDLSRRLSGGDTIHFNACNPHQIENVEKNSVALLLIVRAPQFPR